MYIPRELDIAIQAKLIPDSHQVTLRALKSRLRSIFPDAKSSHLTESIAFALKFQSNAALRASQVPDSIAIASFDPIRFCERIRQLQRSSKDELKADPVVSPPPAQLLELADQLTAIGCSPLMDFQARPVESVKSNALIRNIANVTAEALDLGAPDTSIFPRPAVRGSSDGVDHASCIPGWGRVVSPNRTNFLDGLYLGSAWRFERKLPLANGSIKKYTDAVLTLTYDKGHWRSTHSKDVNIQATLRGWTCTPVTGWFGDAQPMLLRRSTSHERLQELWETSFVCWVCENELRLKEMSDADAWHLAIEDVVECPHIPLDLTSFEDLTGRYLAEVPYPTYGLRDVGQLKALEALIALWKN